ncbi:MAG: hypothetical protein LUG89_01790 [Methanosphaera sp.]|nr:hypothetical protein [Methanosphaera sp.]
MSKIKWFISIVLIVAAIGVVLYTSGITSTSGVTYSANGVSFNYPSTWMQANTTAESTVAAVALTDDPSVSVVIQKVPESFGSDIQNASSYNLGFLQQSEGYSDIQMINSSINNQSVVMHRYLQNNNEGTQVEHVATWIKADDGNIYVILFTTPIESYEQQRSSYDLIAGTFESSSTSQSIIDSIMNFVTGG